MDDIKFCIVAILKSNVHSSREHEIWGEYEYEDATSAVVAMERIKESNLYVAAVMYKTFDDGTVQRLAVYPEPYFD